MKTFCFMYNVHSQTEREKSGTHPLLHTQKTIENFNLVYTQPDSFDSCSTSYCIRSHHHFSKSDENFSVNVDSVQRYRTEGEISASKHRRNEMKYIKL